MLFMFPVIDLTTIGTIIELVIQIGQTAVEIGILHYLVFEKGWLDLIRLISFWLDTLVIKYIDKFYSYFDKILNGKIFAPDVIERVMNSVYLFVSVIVLFKLIMLLIKYVANPEMVSDEKGGGGALVKRIVIGMSLMLFLNTIFDYGYKLQSAILNDNIFGKVLLTKGQLSSYEKNKDQMGRLLGFNIYQAFWNLDTNQITKKSIINRYNNAISIKDPTAFGDINEKYGNDYAIDYFPILSTVMLFYVLYLIIKYCIDIVVRMFKLFVLQMLGPIAIADYMVDGDKEGMFKAWTKTTIAAYAMLFMRVFCIWFVAFITTLMNQKCTKTVNGVCTDSLLYITTDSAGNATPDYLLRALITLGLLAFLMDLPKLLSELFGLDLEQDASVKGLMGKVGGAAKMVGMGALAAGGAAVGGALGSMKAGTSALKQFGQNKAQTKAKLAKLDPSDPNYAQKSKAIKQQSRLHNATLASNTLGTAGGFASGVMAAALSSTPLNSAVGSSSNASSSVQNRSNEYGNNTAVALKVKEDKLADIKSEEEKAKAEKAEADTAQYRQHQMATSAASYGQQVATNKRLSQISENTEVTATQTVNMNQQLGTVSGNIEAIAQNTETTAQQIVNVDQKLGKIDDNVGQIKTNTNMIAEDTIQQTINVEQQLGEISSNVGKVAANTDMIAEDTIQQTLNVEQLVETTTGGEVPSTNDNKSILDE